MQLRAVGLRGQSLAKFGEDPILANVTLRGWYAEPWVWSGAKSVAVTFFSMPDFGIRGALTGRPGCFGQQITIRVAGSFTRVFGLRSRRLSGCA